MQVLARVLVLVLWSEPQTVRRVVGEAAAEVGEVVAEEEKLAWY